MRAASDSEDAIDVFRDATDLTATPALWPGIVAHLESAEWLLVFACPAWAASMWRNKEVQWWLDHCSPDRMFIVLTGGDIVAAPLDARDLACLAKLRSVLARHGRLRAVALRPFRGRARSAPARRTR